jgi:hypothetical protein
LRTNVREQFAYLGELQYKTHRQFTDATSGKMQQRYTRVPKNRIPDRFLEELTFGVSPSSTRSERQGVGGEKRSRMPSSFDQLKRAYSYAIDSSERTVTPEHQNYQVRLKNFLNTRQIVADMERDYVDVGFSFGGLSFIGEIKVTTNLTPAQAFRAALGQVLDYAYVLYPKPPKMIVFLDANVEAKRLKLASDLGIAVVVEQSETFELVSLQATSPLRSVFPTAANMGDSGDVCH